MTDTRYEAVVEDKALYRIETHEFRAWYTGDLYYVDDPVEIELDEFLRNADTDDWYDELIVIGYTPEEIYDNDQHRDREPDGF